MDIESKKPMPKDGIFRLASMSKPITGAAVLMLVEEGKIRLNDPVSRFIPEFKGVNKVAVPKPGAAAAGRGGRPGGRARRGPPPEVDLVSATREITIKDLLTHGSGLMSGGLGQRQPARRSARRPTRSRPTSRSWRRAARLPAGHALALQRPGRLRRAEPRRRSGVGSDVRPVPQAAALRSARHEGHRLLARRRTAPRVWYALHAAARAAGAARTRIRSSGISEVYFSGAGGMMSTAEDYLQFAQMLVNGGELNGKRFLGPRTVELDGVESYRRHGERPVRPAGPRHGLRPRRADRPRPRGRRPAASERARSVGPAGPASTSTWIRRSKWSPSS